MMSRQWILPIYVAAVVTLTLLAVVFGWRI